MALDGQSETGETYVTGKQEQLKRLPGSYHYIENQPEGATGSNQMVTLTDAMVNYIDSIKNSDIEKELFLYYTRGEFVLILKKHIHGIKVGTVIKIWNHISEAIHE
eukprot:92019_1